jgi:hypothetical protein
MAQLEGWALMPGPRVQVEQAQVVVGNPDASLFLLTAQFAVPAQADDVDAGGNDVAWLHV